MTDDTKGAGMPDKGLLKIGSSMALQMHEQLSYLGAPSEEIWIVIALAARALERGVIAAGRDSGGLDGYRRAQERLARLYVESDLRSEEADRAMRAEDGKAEPVQS